MTSLAYNQQPSEREKTAFYEGFKALNEKIGEVNGYHNDHRRIYYAKTF
jgi:hypothetical protein